MTVRKKMILGGVVAAVLLVGILVASVTALARSSATPHPPIVAGQTAPTKVVPIDFGKRYDLHCALRTDQLTVYRNCKIIGFTGQDGKDSSSSSGSYGVLSRSSFPYFDAW